MPRDVSPYRSFGDYLVARAAAGEGRVTLAFATIEGPILGRPLPPTARRPGRVGDFWLADGRHAVAWDGWLRVGWRVAALDLAAGTVTFARGEEA